jgi:hypothetical protein
MGVDCGNACGCNDQGEFQLTQGEVKLSDTKDTKEV